jgi:hypothetical protein
LAKNIGALHSIVRQQVVHSFSALVAQSRAGEQPNEEWSQEGETSRDTTKEKAVDVLDQMESDI